MAKDKTTISIPDKLKREARARAIREGLDLSKVVRIFLAAWLDGEIQLPSDDDSGQQEAE